MTATQVSKTAGMKILGRLATISSESTKPVAKPSILLAMALGSTPIIFASTAMARARFQAASRDKEDQANEQPADTAQDEPELDVHFDAEEWDNGHDKESRQSSPVLCPWRQWAKIC